MPTTSEVESSPARAGTNADLARRMDRLEGRQDGVEKEVRDLAVTVGRVESNQKHADELSLLRHQALETGIKSLGGQFSDFTRRFEAILTGEVETVQMKQGQAMLLEWNDWRKTVNGEIEALQEAKDQGAARTAGRVDVISWAKAVALVVIAAIPSAVVLVEALR
ncbi:MAG TPA: hypothetical protein VFI40_04945 [Nocardioides sp.]|nr:hypothetical protein [Nocardioides sp.]